MAVTKINVVLWNEGDPEEPVHEFTHGLNHALRLLTWAEKERFMVDLKAWLEKYDDKLGKNKGKKGGL